MMTEREWLDSLTAGDAVAIQTRYGPEIREVARVTPTQIIVGRTQERFRKSNGSPVGGDTWSYRYLVPVTPAVQAEILARQLRRRLAVIVEGHRTFDLELVRLLVSTYDKAMEERE